MNKPKGFWLRKKNCVDEAQKYASRSEWQKSNPLSYRYACLYGWLDDCASHMLKAKKKPNGYWDKKNCRAEAQKYASRSSWQDSSPISYRTAMKNGWLDYCASHMVTSRKADGFWTLARCKAEAKKYRTRAEWRLHQRSSYGKAVKESWLDECCAHMDRGVKWFGPSAIQEFLLAHDVAHKCEHRFKSEPSMAKLPFDFYIPKYNLLVEYHGEQHRTGWGRKDADAKQIQARDALKKRWALESQYNYIEIRNWEITSKSNIWEKLTDGLRRAANREGFQLNLVKRALTPRERKLVKSRLKWTQEVCCAEATKYSSIGEWQLKSASSYNAAFQKGWIDACTGHMERKLHKRNYWTLERCAEESRKYASKKAWINAPRSGYTTAVAKGWVEQCSSHFVDGRKLVGNRKWTLEVCRRLAATCSTRAEFKSKSASAYQRARVRGWLDECCAHMK
jgi:very-short-patch-repair endonuclease